MIPEPSLVISQNTKLDILRMVVQTMEDAWAASFMSSTCSLGNLDVQCLNKRAACKTPAAGDGNIVSNNIHTMEKIFIQ